MTARSPLPRRGAAASSRRLLAWLATVRWIRCNSWCHAMRCLLLCAAWVGQSVCSGTAAATADSSDSQATAPTSFNPPKFLSSGAVDEIEELRLAGGPTKYEGRVEVRINGSWSVVGSDFNPGNAAQVVCRQLGYAGGAARGGSLYGMGAGAPDAAAGAMVPVQMIVELSCNGSEASLNDCSWWTNPGYGYPQEVACDGEAGHTGVLASPSSKAIALCTCGSPHVQGVCPDREADFLCLTGCQMRCLSQAQVRRLCRLCASPTMAALAARRADWKCRLAARCAQLNI